LVDGIILINFIKKKKRKRKAERVKIGFTQQYTIIFVIITYCSIFNESNVTKKRNRALKGKERNQCDNNRLSLLEDVSKKQTVFKTNMGLFGVGCKQIKLTMFALLHAFYFFTFYLIKKVYIEKNTPF
jgi:hypothetical protein